MMRYLAVLVPLLAAVPAHAEDAYGEVLRWATDPKAPAPVFSPGERLWGKPPTPVQAAPDPKPFSTSVVPERAVTRPPPAQVPARRSVPAG
jgi:hypothetical protein